MTTSGTPETPVLAVALEEVWKAYRRCSPSACWSAQYDLERGTPPDREYPLQHLRRLAAELAVLFGEQHAARLANGEIPYGYDGNGEAPQVPEGLARSALQAAGRWR